MSIGLKQKILIKKKLIIGLSSRVKCFLTLVLVSFSLFGCGDNAEQSPNLRIAVASNFQVPMSILVEEFKKQHPLVNVSISSASSGVLFSQIKRGAPYELFFSADSVRPITLAKEFNLTDRVYTYAVGRLVLWIPGATSIDLSSIGKLERKIAIAQPDLAPYGLATKQVLEKNGLWESTQDVMVFGNNVTQVEHFVKTGAVSAGFLSLAQVMLADVDMQHVWFASNNDYVPIEQKVIHLNKGSNSSISQRFLDFVLSKQGQSIIKTLGYDVVDYHGESS